MITRSMEEAWEMAKFREYEKWRHDCEADGHLWQCTQRKEEVAVYRCYYCGEVKTEDL